MKDFIIKMFNPPLKLTEKEEKVQNIVQKLLEKENTTIDTNFQAQSFILANKELNFNVEINGNILISTPHSSTSETFRLSFMEQLKKFVMEEESRRYQEKRESIFKNTLSQLDEMNKQLTL